VGLQTLAAAYYSSQQYDRAIETARRALRFAEQQRLADLVRQIRAVLPTYESAGQPTTTSAPATQPQEASP
jgi:hypothetical protein